MTPAESHDRQLPDLAGGPVQRFDYPAVGRVTAGVPCVEAVPEEVERLGARRALLFVSASLERRTGIAEALGRALGARYAGMVASQSAHITDAIVLEAAGRLRGCDADLAVVVGGGALVDTVKMAVLAVTHEVREASQLAPLRLSFEGEGGPKSPCRLEPRLRQLVVPTTLTGAEWSDLTGSAERPEAPKRYYSAQRLGALSVVYDPWLAVHTPLPLWLSSGMRAVDHAVEGICSVAPAALMEAAGVGALRLLGQALPRCREAPEDVAARAACQRGAWLAATGVGRVRVGASHGLGHLLAGLAGVPHGLTSALLLPSVLRFNRAVNADRQALCAEALGAEDAADAVASLVERLGLRQPLADLRLSAERLRPVAEAAPGHFLVRSNPRPIRQAADAMAILEDALRALPPPA